MSADRYINLLPAQTDISSDLQALYDDMSENEYTNEEYADAVAEIVYNILVACGISDIAGDSVVFGYYYESAFYSDSSHENIITPNTEILYFDMTGYAIYYYTGAAYTLITSTLTLGETSTTAYRGDRGASAYAHSLLTSGNPHNVTASDVDLGNVPNVTTDNQTPTWTIASSLTALVSGEVLSTAFGKIAKAITSLISHIADVSNPHSVTASQVGLGNVDNTADADKSVLSATKWTTARSFYISDATSAHTGTAVSVNGSANPTLLLPATITANIIGGVTGNATTATTLATARTINISDYSSENTGTGISFNGSSNGTILLPSKLNAIINNKVTQTSSTASVTYWSVTCSSVTDSIIAINSRGGESLLVGFGLSDSAYRWSTVVTRISNSYTKITSVYFSSDYTVLYITLASYPNRLTANALFGDAKPTITITQLDSIPSGVVSASVQDYGTVSGVTPGAGGLLLLALSALSSLSPIMDGTAASGSSNIPSRQDHVHPTDTSRAPTSHASTATTYGVGTTANYGHNLLINALTETAYTAGHALSAYQGYLLNNLIANKADDSDVMHLTGAETAAGVKTFSSGIVSDVTGDLTGNADTATILKGYVTVSDYDSFDPTSYSLGSVIPLYNSGTGFAEANTNTGILLCTANTYTIIAQRSGQTSSGLYTRAYYNSTWGSWQQISSATKLATAISLIVKDYSLTYSGTSISFDGSASVSLPLPSTLNQLYYYSSGKLLPFYTTLDLSSLDTSYFYPVTFPNSDFILDCEIRSPSLLGSASYNQNSIHFQLQASGWSDNPKRFDVLQYGLYQTDEITIGSIGYGTTNGLKCVWLRGGMIYRYYGNFIPTIHTSDYSYGSSSAEIYTVGTNLYGGTNTNVAMIWQASSESGLNYPSYHFGSHRITGNLLIDGTFNGVTPGTGGLLLLALSALSSLSPVMNGTAASGSSNIPSRQDHVHPTDTSRAPTSHASTATTYGVGTTANYGHNLLINALTETAYTAGHALSAYQGYLLKEAIDDKMPSSTLIFPNATSDPSSASVGQAWFRTDL